jgi:hypothetical protein
MSEAALYCANHPDRETSLRCNRCEKLICASCAIQTPTGYRCEECVRGQQRIFVTAKPQDYVLAFIVAAPLSYLGALIARFLGSFGFFGFFLVILFSPFAGGLIAEAVRVVVQKRRGAALFRVAAAAVILGGLPSLLGPVLFVFSGSGIGGVFAIIWPALYLGLSTSAFYYRLSGISIGR